MANELEVISDITDTQFFVQEKSFTAQDVMDGIDELLNVIQMTGDFDRGVGALRSLSAVNRVSGWGSAKLLYGMADIWAASGKDSDEFVDFMVDGSRLSSLTIERYIRAWEAVKYFPNQFEEHLLSLPIKNGVALGAAIAQGYEPSEEQMQELSSTHDNSKFLQIIRDMKKKKPRVGTLTLYLETDGSIRGWMDGKVELVGFLEVKSKKALVKKAIERIKTRSGLQMKKE